MLRFPLRFGLLFQGEGTYPKKVDVKTFPISSSNRGHQSCIGRKCRISKKPSFFRNRLQKYYIRDISKRYIRMAFFMVDPATFSNSQVWGGLGCLKVFQHVGKEGIFIDSGVRTSNFKHQKMTQTQSAI